jgi:2'-5' RNA ligase
MSRGATARLFVAVDPPEEVRDELFVWARGAVAASTRHRGSAVADMRLLEREALHLTLCFLGWRPVGEIELIGSTLASCAKDVGELALGAPVWLPPRRPGVLAVEVHDREGGLAALHRAVNGALADAIGWQPERRRFRAHITVARARGSARSRRRDRFRGSGGSLAAANGTPLALPATPQLSFKPASVVLYRSRLAPGGASYQALAECELLAAGL